MAVGTEVCDTLQAPLESRLTHKTKALWFLSRHSAMVRFRIAASRKSRHIFLMAQTDRLLATTILLPLPFPRKGSCSATRLTKTSDLNPQSLRKCKLQVHHHHHHPTQAKEECFYNPASPTVLQFHATHAELPLGNFRSLRGGKATKMRRRVGNVGMETMDFFYWRLHICFCLLLYFV